MLERELGDLRVGQKREIALDLMRKERAVAEPVRDVMGAEDDLIRIGVPEAAHAALRGRLRVGLKVTEQKPVGRFRFVQDVGAKLVALRIITQTPSL